MQDFDSAAIYKTVDDVVRKVTTIFKPGTFSVSLFTRKGQRHVAKHSSLLLSSILEEFACKNRVIECLGRWDLTFAHFEKLKSSKGSS